MRRLRRIALAISFAGLMGFVQASLADETLAIITQSANPLKTISLETLKLVYLRKSMLDSHNLRWIPLNFPASSHMRQAFSLRLFNQLPEDQEDYWNEQYFQGIDPPLVLMSEEAMLRFVTMTPGAIGYVHKRSVDARVKILLILTISTPK